MIANFVTDGWLAMTLACLAALFAILTILRSL